MRFYYFLLCVLCTLCCFVVQAQQYDPGAGSTNLLIGQTFRSEYQDYINGTGLTPAGSSHYATFFLGAIEQGDDDPNSQFLDWVRSNQSNPYALVALSFKDNTDAGGYGQMTDDSQPLNANAVWDALKDVTSGAWDAEIDDFSQIMSSRSDTRFYLRIGYEVSLLLFAYNDGSQYVNDWLTEQANAGINVFDDPDAVAEMDRQAYIDAYNYIANRIRNVNGVTNVDFVYHPVRGLNDTRWLYPGSQFVDWVAFSIFNNDVCVEVNGTFNCEGEGIDPQLQQSIDFAKQQGHPIMIAEAAVQAPASSTSGEFIDYLNRLHDVVVDNDVRVLAYINSNWPIHGWGPEWGDSRVEENTSVRNHWMSVFGTGTRYIHSGGTAPTPTCTDGIQNGDETGVDCGGSCPNSCPTVPTCTDGIQNGDETGVDCGGSCPNNCPTTGGGDCGEFGITYVDNTTGIIYHRDNGYRANYQYLCLDGDCRPGTLEDGYYKRTVEVSLNQTYNVEFRVDAVPAQVSVTDQFTFTTAACSFTGGGTTPTCTDGIQNGDETGVDCGGSCPNSCPTGPTCTDGIRNGDETGVDCGGSCPNNCPEPPSGDLAFLEPTNGAKLLFVGQDLLSISDYMSDCENCPTPGGTAAYVNLSGVLQSDFYGALGYTEADQPYGVDVDWGGGPLNAYSNAIGFSNSAVQIGLYLVGETDNIASGGRDGEIVQMADFFKALPNTAFYLRIGYEFDGQWNGYSGPSYVDAYRRMVDILRREGVSNVAYVWQSSTSPIDDILDGGRENLLNYYPGDDYVDWFGMSWFLPPTETATVGATPSTQLFLANEMMSLARERNKPMMICESAAQGYDIQVGATSHISSVWDGDSGEGTVNKTGEQIWNEWFQPYFDYIYANDDVIKAVTYINADWDSQGLWDAPYEQGYWGDTRIQGNSVIETNWVNEITKAGWLHGSSNLNSFLNGMTTGGVNPPAPTCTDGIQNGNETGVDCGGSCPNSCNTGGGTEPTCTDGIQNGDETGVDCGGSCPNSCSTPPATGNFISGKFTPKNGRLS